MNESKSQNALVPTQYATLARRSIGSLAKRGLDDWESQESAEGWFKKAKELYNAVPRDCPAAEFRASLEEFFRCLRHAADLNPQHPGIQYWLGTAYRDGLGTETDAVAAAKWLGDAAEQGFAEAQVQFAGMLMYGEGVSEDVVKATSLFRKAAEQNHVDAQVALGVAFADGIGVTKDLVESVRWFRKAAEQNSDSGQYFLAEALAEGRGVSKDPLEAAKWYRKAASQGVARAQYRLGSLYYRGEGVLEDLAEAERWFALAAKQRDKDAAIMLEVVKAGLTYGALKNPIQEIE